MSKVDTGRLLELITAAYNSDRHQLTQNSQEALLEAARALEKGEEPTLIVSRLAHYINIELLAFGAGTRASKSLAELAIYLNHHRGTYSFKGLWEPCKSVSFEV